jgi:hypothetical protein
MKFLFTIAFWLLYLTVDGQSNLGKRQKYVTPIPVSEKRLEIPIYEDIKDVNLPFVYWHFSKQKEKQLGLRSPETDKNSTIFRVWITHPVGMKNQPHGLIEILNDSAGWRGQLILMSVNFNYNKLSEIIKKSKIIELQPVESEWSTIMDSLLYYKINELPTDEKIPGYYIEENRYNNNKPTYAFEYSTADSYRFFQYNNIYRAIDSFWQPKYVDSILDLLERNFYWDKTARAYFSSN